jgi:hypothetical protein
MPDANEPTELNGLLNLVCLLFWRGSASTGLCCFEQPNCRRHRHNRYCRIFPLADGEVSACAAERRASAAAHGVSLCRVATSIGETNRLCVREHLMKDRTTLLVSAVAAIALLSAAVTAQPSRRAPEDPLASLESDLRFQMELRWRADRPTYNAHMAQLEATLTAWRASPQSAGDRELLANWLREAMTRSLPGDDGPWPNTPTFVQDETAAVARSVVREEQVAATKAGSSDNGKSDAQHKEEQRLSTAAELSSIPPAQPAPNASGMTLSNAEDDGQAAGANARTASIPVQKSEAETKASATRSAETLPGTRALAPPSETKASRSAPPPLIVNKVVIDERDAVGAGTQANAAPIAPRGGATRETKRLAMTVSPPFETTTPPHSAEKAKALLPDFAAGMAAAGLPESSVLRKPTEPVIANQAASTLQSATASYNGLPAKAPQTGDKPAVAASAQPPGQQHVSVNLMELNARIRGYHDGLDEIEASIVTAKGALSYQQAARLVGRIEELGAQYRFVRLYYEAISQQEKEFVPTPRSMESTLELLEPECERAEAVDADDILASASGASQAGLADRLRAVAKTVGPEK